MRTWPRRPLRSAALIALALGAGAPEVSGQDLFSGAATVEGRAFPSGGLYPGQHNAFGSVTLEPELFWSTSDGQHAFTLAPFMRLDGGDSERTHVDLREAYWRTYGEKWELEAGLVRTFWGVTESQHLVDVVNQTDQVENSDGEDKLGQPAVHGTWLADWGTIDVYLMPRFRERTFPGAEGRFRFPLLIDEDAAEIERTLGVAARWSHYFGPLDLGVSSFYGTARDPRFQVVGTAENPTGFAPVYEEVHQLSVDAQLIQGAWAWKVEAITRSGQGDRFQAFTGGFEFTLGNVGNSGLDIGLLAEYSHDTRTSDFSQPLVAVSVFDNDLFMGGRFALNDVQSTAILAGAVLDVDLATVSWLVEASRRVGESFTGDFEIRAVTNADLEDPFYFFRKDSYAQLGLSWYY